MRRHAVAAATMFAGGVGTLAMLLLLNRHGEQAPAAESAPAVAFEVPPPPPPPRVAPKPPPRRVERARAPAAPSLTGSMGGLDLGLGAAGLLSDLAEGLLGDTSGVVMTEDAVDEPPRPLARPAGPYPARARSKGITGRVLLRVLVGADGAVTEMKVEEADPVDVFEEAAMETVGAWTFAPGRYRGAAVPAWVRVPLRFELDG